MKFGVFVVLLSPESSGGTLLDSAISGEAGEVVMQKGRNEINRNDNEMKTQKNVA